MLIMEYWTEMDQTPSLPAQILRWVQLRLHLYFSYVYISSLPMTVTVPKFDPTHDCPRTKI